MNKIVYIIGISIIGFLVACNPKVAEVVDDKPKEEVVELTEEEKLCRTFSQLGALRNTAMENFVLYRDQVKAGNFEEAYPMWSRAFSLAPKSDGKKTYHYDDGVKIFTYFYNKETDADKKKMWVDSVKYLYNRRERCFGEGDYLAAREGFDMYYNFKEHVDQTYIYNKFKKSADGLGEKLPYFAINPFTKLIVDMMGSGDLEMAEANKYAMLILDAIKYGNDNCGDKCDTWDIINNYAPIRLEALEGYAGFYDCDYYYNKYYPEFEANGTDCDIIEKVGIRLKRGGCDLEGEAIAALTEAFKANCKSEVPVAKGPLSEAFQLYRDGKYQEAVVKFDEYFAAETDPLKKSKYQLVVAKIYYRDIKNFPKARSYAKQAAENRANWGDPFILIGKLYASSGPICGPGTGWDSQIVTWPAIDKWNYAKKIDPSVASEANKLIGTYKKFMPDVTEIFSRPNVSEGGPFYVGCWIKENTTVRAAK